MLFLALLLVFQICGGPLWGLLERGDDNGFDARGNVVSRAGSDGSTQQLAWDALGRLSSVMARHLLFRPGHGKRLENGLGPKERRGGRQQVPIAVFLSD
jgi:YD repeat-containing protein